VNPVTDVRALEEKNVWEVQYLFYASSFVTRESLLLGNGLGEIGDKFR